MSKSSARNPTSRSTIRKPRLVITLGDPAGIGPEIVARAVRDLRVRAVCHPIVVGAIPSPLQTGKPSRIAGRAAIGALEEAVALIQSGQADAMVTAPVSKESFALADYGFPGHTEWLAQKSKAKSIAMLMVAGPLRTILMTRHVPLSRVSRTLTRSVIEESARLAYDFVKTILKKSAPRIALCGLNPHAGDNGILGTEEQRVMRPAVTALRRRGISVTGPLSSDVVFKDMVKGVYDLALAAYHDQGMIPLKVHAPERMVNITLGLPYIRTSPAHGTAYDLAGQGKASIEPMVEAIRLAARYSR